MKMLIAGARERDTGEDRTLVGELIERITAEAPHTLYVGMLTHMGVGEFVRDKCMEKEPGTGRFRYPLIECTVRVFAMNLSKSDLTAIYMARNSTPFDMSDMLVYLASEDRRGTMEDMLDRFQKSGRPVLVLMPGDVLPESVIGAVTIAG